MSFYVTLPNGSEEGHEYPFNNISHYNTYLPMEIALDSNYEVALSEIQYTNAFFNINDTSHVYVSYREDTENDIHVVVPVERGYYESGADLTREIMAGVRMALPSNLRTKVNLRFEKVTKLYELTITENQSRVGIMFDPTIGKIMKFPTSEIITTSTNSTHPTDIFASTHSMYIYTNIITPQIVGDSRVPLLRAVSVHGNHNEHVRDNFYHLQYVPVKLRNFRTIEIDIRNNIGELMPFHSGEVIVTLHFRRARF